MIRSLYTAATGMLAQQLNLDVIANNLANVNTAGFKKSKADFQDLMYQVIEEPGTATNPGASPTGIQVGLGVKPAAVGKLHSQGDFAGRRGARARHTLRHRPLRRGEPPDHGKTQGADGRHHLFHASRLCRDLPGRTVGQSGAGVQYRTVQPLRRAAD